MSTKHLLLMLLAIFIAVGASASVSGTAALQTRGNTTAQRDSTIQSRLERERNKAKSNTARRIGKKRVGKGSSETKETADIDVSGKTGETYQTTVYKSDTQPVQKTVEEVNKEKEAEKAKEEASSSNNQQSTGHRPPTSTSSNSKQGGRRRR